MMIRFFFPVFIIFLTLCEEELLMEFGFSDEIIVLDGMVINETQPYFAKLSKSFEALNPEHNNVKEGEGYIDDVLSLSERIKEIDSGVYKKSIHFIDTDTKKINKIYCLLFKQYCTE